jgi:HAD superfamily hydrolase (TIGR01549 family)
MFAVHACIVSGTAMIEAVLFDLGNTLMHDGSDDARGVLDGFGRALHEWLVRIGSRPPAYPIYRRRIRRRFLRAYLWSQIRRREVPVLRTVQTTHRDMGISLTDEQIDEMGLQCVPVLSEFLRPDQAAAPLIQVLSTAGFKLGIVSNTMVPGFAMDEHLRRRGWLDYFPVRVYSSEVGYKKPHHRIFRLALDKLGVSPEKTLFVGDNVVNDVYGPARLGMQTVLLAPEGRSPQGRKRPNHVIRGLSEIPTLLQSLGATCD